MTFWTNGLDFANLMAKGSPLGADSMLLADSASSPPGQPKQALMSNFPVASTISSFSANQPVITGAASTSPLLNISAGTAGQLQTSQGASAPIFRNYGINLPAYNSGVSYLATGLFHPQGTVGTYPITAGVLYLLPFIPYQTYPFVGIGVNITTGIALSTVAMGIYSVSSSMYFANLASPLANSSSGSISSATSSTFVSYTFSSPITLVGGNTYWLAFWGSSSAVVVGGLAAGSTTNSGLYNTTTSGLGGAYYVGAYSATLPSSVSLSGGIVNNFSFPMMFLIG